MHKGDYHTDYSKYYDKEYKDKDLAYEHVKSLKREIRKETVQVSLHQEMDKKDTKTKRVIRKIFRRNEGKEEE